MGIDCGDTDDAVIRTKSPGVRFPKPMELFYAEFPVRRLGIFEPKNGRNGFERSPGGAREGFSARMNVPYLKFLLKWALITKPF